MRQLKRLSHQNFGNFGCSGFDHQKSFLGASNAQIERRNFHFLDGGVHHQFSVHKTNSDCPDWTAKGNVGNHQSSRSGVDREHVQRIFRVCGKRHQHDLDFIAHAFREERAQRAVGQASHECGIGGGASFAAEERSGDFAAGVHTFFVIHSQREEVTALTQVAHCGCSKHHTVTLAQDY